MEFSLNTYGIWEIGQRAKQEDTIFPSINALSSGDRLFILCDGMGGHEAGDVASKTVCTAMSEYILHKNIDPQGEFTDEDFKKALNYAYDVLDCQDIKDENKKMGTTLAFLKFHAKGCTIAHIGDSRVYHIRPGNSIQDTQILFQTIDHSLLNDLLRLGEITPEEAKTSKQRNIITKAMQPNSDRRYDADLYHTSDIEAGDYFLLCSDGILENMDNSNIKYIFSDKGGDAINKIDILSKCTLHNKDNHSAIIIYVDEVRGKECNVSEDIVLNDSVFLPIGESSNAEVAHVSELDHESDPNLGQDPNSSVFKNDPILDEYGSNNSRHVYIPFWLWVLLIIAVLLFASYKIYVTLNDSTEKNIRKEKIIDENKNRTEKDSRIRKRVTSPSTNRIQPRKNVSSPSKSSSMNEPERNMEVETTDSMKENQISNQPLEKVDTSYKDKRVQENIYEPEDSEGEIIVDSDEQRKANEDLHNIDDEAVVDRDEQRNNSKRKSDAINI